jgi:hypothetical protein
MRKFFKYILFLAAVLILPVGAKACPVSVTITATNEETGQSQVTTLGGETSLDIITGDFVWVLDHEVSILDGSIDRLKLTVNADPEVGIEFGVRANKKQIFTILSDVVLFDPLVNPTAYASAAITLTDRGPTAGATITGFFDGGKTYQARYNGSTVFANLVDSFGIPNSSGDKNEARGNESSMITINDTLTSIESEFHFTLSVNDSASGTSTFVVVPEPATIALLGLGALSLIRRKKVERMCAQAGQ